MWTPGSPSNLSQTFVLESEMGLSSNVRLPPFHLTQFRTSENFRPARDPDHYERIDQIGRG
jgi:hypothetical protein